MNILFTCAGRRNYLLGFFKEELHGQGLVMAADMQLSAPAMAIADKKFIVPPVYDPGYIDLLLKISQENSVNALISLNDLELPLLARRKKEFESIGVKLVLADENVIDIAFDKLKTIDFANRLEIKTPKTHTSLKSALDALQRNQLHFPLVVKPRWGSASIGLAFPGSLEELELSYRLLSLRLGNTMLGEASKADYDHAILIQEQIEGTEYGVDILNDFSGIPQQVYVKEKLSMRAGETDKSVLRNRPEIEAIGNKLGANLKHIGNLDCDIFEKDGNYFLLEINPRFGGGYPFTHYSGGNYVAAIIAFLKNESFDFKKFTRNYDTIFSKCDTLLRVL